MILCVTGFGWSGSGAVQDLLKEYSELNIIDNNGKDWEFYLLHETDGIYDLEYNCVHKHSRINSYVSFLRFKRLVDNYCKYLHYEDIFKGNFKRLTNDYIKSLVDFRFEGCTFYESFNQNIFQRFYNKVIRATFGNRWVKRVLGNSYLKLRIRNKSEILVSYRPHDFVNKTKAYLNNLFDCLQEKTDNRTIVLDQVFPPDCPELFMKYIDGSKCIIVRRDPRDTYLLSKCAYNSEIPIPVHDVKDFICFYKKVVEETFIENNSNILNVKFEDLIYEYDSTIHTIEAFLNIKQHINPKAFFDPSISINNTQLFKKYKGYETEIECIEKSLSKSLYDFDKYPVVDHSMPVF